MPTYEEAGLTFEEHEARQRRAEALPLEVGTELAWTGSSLEPGSQPPPDYPHNRSISPSPLRALETRLLDPSHGVAAQPWRLELVEPLLRGTNQYSEIRFSQMWRAVAIPRDEDARIPVVLKLYQESLYFRCRQKSDYVSTVGPETAKRLRQAESYVYSVARDLQGSDIPLCYGFYTFQQPSGEVSVGVVLEDLQYKRKGIPLPKHLERELKLDTLTFEEFDDIICAALRLQNRLHKFGIDDAVFELNQFVLLQSPADQSVRSWTLVGLGFSETRPKPEDSEVDEEAIRNGTSDESWWNKWDQYRLYSSATDVTVRLDDVFDGLARGWGDFEMKRKRLDFLYMNQRPPRARKQQPSRSEETREDQLKLDAMLKDMFE